MTTINDNLLFILNKTHAQIRFYRLKFGRSFEIHTLWLNASFIRGI